jgi:hypothetical protein
MKIPSAMLFNEADEKNYRHQRHLLATKNGNFNILS